MGYDFVPGALAGALALDATRRTPRASTSATTRSAGRLNSLSAGTRESLVGVTLDDGFAYRDGPRADRADGRARALPSRVAGSAARRSRSAARSTSRCRAPYPGLREVNVYLGWFGPLARPLQAGTLVGEYVTQLPLARDDDALLGRARRVARGRPGAGHDAGRSPPGSPPRRTTPTGRQLSEVHLAGADAYDFTASFLAWAAQQPVTGTGALGPVAAYGLEALEAGVASAGLARSPLRGQTP